MSWLPLFIFHDKLNYFWKSSAYWDIHQAGNSTDQFSLPQEITTVGVFERTNYNINWRWKKHLQNIKTLAFKADASEEHEKYAQYSYIRV